MVAPSIQIYKDHVLFQTGEHLTNVLLEDDGKYEMYVQSQGTAEAVVVGRGCTLTVKDNGVVEGLTIRDEGACSVFSDAVARQVELGGIVSLYNGGTLFDCIAGEGARILAFTGSRVFSVTVGAGAYLYGSNNEIFQKIEVEDGAKLDLTDVRLEETYLSTDANYSLKRCALVNCTLADGFSGLSGKGILAEEKLYLAGRCKDFGTLDVSGATLAFCLDLRLPGQEAFLGAWPEAGSPAACAAVVAETQDSGEYTLLDDVQGFDQPLAIFLRGDESPVAELSLGSPVTLEKVRYFLEQDGTSLCIAVDNRQILRFTNGATTIECDGGWRRSLDRVSLYGRQLNATVEEREWFAESGAPLKIQNIESGEAPARVVAEAADDVSFFQANACGTWPVAYCACNTFTGAEVELQGKNRFSDVFAGSFGKAVLVLTEASDALFADDIYSAFAISTESRLQEISEIHAGAGDDIVDLTCRNVPASSSGCLLDGGAGDDVLWGGVQAAVLVGGAGDDTLVSHRSGALFVFGENWGQDTVQVGEGRDYRLCFAAGAQIGVAYDDFGARISCGDDSLTVQGIFSDVEDKFLFGAEAGASYSGFPSVSLALFLGETCG